MKKKKPLEVMIIKWVIFVIPLIFVICLFTPLLLVCVIINIFKDFFGGLNTLSDGFIKLFNKFLEWYMERYDCEELF